MHIENEEVISSRAALERYDAEHLDAFKKMKYNVLAELDTLYAENRNLKIRLDNVPVDQEEFESMKSSLSDARNSFKHAIFGMLLLFMFGLSMLFLAIFAS